MKHFVQLEIPFDTEIWMDIDGFTGYQVSNLGNVRSCRLKNGHCSTTYHMLKPILHTTGYTSVSLQIGGKMTQKSIHRLVCETFIPNPNNLPCVNHKDCNRQNNSLNNLEWCSYKYNNTYGNRIELMTQKISKKVICLDTGVIFDSVKQASEHINIDRHKISRCCKGKQFTAGGFHWKYAS